MTGIIEYLPVKNRLRYTFADQKFRPGRHFFRAFQRRISYFVFIY